MQIAVAGNCSSIFAQSGKLWLKGRMSEWNKQTELLGTILWIIQCWIEFEPRTYAWHENRPRGLSSLSFSSFLWLMSELNNSQGYQDTLWGKRRYCNQLRGCPTVCLGFAIWMHMQQSSLGQFTKSLSAKFVDILMSSTKKSKDHDRVAYAETQWRRDGITAKLRWLLWQLYRYNWTGGNLLLVGVAYAKRNHEMIAQIDTNLKTVNDPQDQAERSQTTTESTLPTLLHKSHWPLKCNQSRERWRWLWQRELCSTRIVAHSKRSNCSSLRASSALSLYRIRSAKQICAQVPVAVGS